MIPIDRLPVIEPVPIADTYVNGVYEIEDMPGGNLRISFFAVRRSVFDGSLEREIRVRIVMHRDDMISARIHAAAILDGNARQRAEERAHH